MKNYVNISTFNGWADYRDDKDILWRREESPSWHDFYRIEQDELIYEGSLPRGLRALSIEDTHKQFIKQMDSVHASRWA